MQSTFDQPDSTAIISHIPIPLFILDEAGIVTFANEACEAFLGKARQKLLGLSISDCLTFEEERLNKILVSSSSDLTAQNMKLTHPKISSNVDITLSSYAEDEAELRLITISPRKPARKHINENQLIGTHQAVGAPAILGHEIKNPLAGIRGAAQLLARNADAAQIGMTELIVAEVDRIARLLDQMQHLGGGSELSLKPQNVHIVLERAIKSIRAANPSVPPISINYDPSIPEVLIDSDGLLQVAINLLQNAVDALADVTDPQIEITTRYVMSGALHAAENDQKTGKTTKLPVEIKICDNGPGVPENIADEIFSPFVSSKRDGQGIGLAIVRKLVRQMHGRIHFERDGEKNLKTKFCFYLPTAETGKNK